MNHERSTKKPASVVHNFSATTTIGGAEQQVQPPCPFPAPEAPGRQGEYRGAISSAPSFGRR